MKTIGENTILSAGDLSNHIACKHLTNLNHAAAKGILTTPHVIDPSPAILQERGLSLEQDYLNIYRSKGVIRGMGYRLMLVWT
jgi:hypothetical protein